MLPAHCPCVAAVQEDNYWRGRHRRDLELEKFNRNFSNVKPFDWFKGLYIWWVEEACLCGRVGGEIRAVCMQHSEL